LRSQEGEQLVVLLLARGATVEVRAHPRVLARGVDAGQLELDVAVELAEALLAPQLPLVGSEQALQPLR
jgi:hypothetical protein